HCQAHHGERREHRYEGRRNRSAASATGACRSRRSSAGCGTLQRAAAVDAELRSGHQRRTALRTKSHLQIPTYRYIPAQHTLAFGSRLRDACCIFRQKFLLTRKPAMQLYDGFGPNPRATRMFLAEKGITIPTKVVDLMT